MKEYVVGIHYGTAVGLEYIHESETLPDRRSKEELVFRIMRARQVARVELLQMAGLLQDVRIIHRNDDFGALHVSGEERAIDALRTFVVANHWGHVTATDGKPAVHSNASYPFFPVEYEPEKWRNEEERREVEKAIAEQPQMPFLKIFLDPDRFRKGGK